MNKKVEGNSTDEIDKYMYGKMDITSIIDNVTLYSVLLSVAYFHILSLATVLSSRALTIALFSQSTL